MLGWCGIDNGKRLDPGTSWVQVGWVLMKNAILPLTYWEYVPDNGTFPSNRQAGVGGPPGATAFYRLEKGFDFASGTDAVLCAAIYQGTYLMTKVIPWSEVDATNFCCWFCGLEVKDTSTDKAPGTASNPNMFTGIRIKDVSGWGSTLPSSNSITDSYFVYFLTEPDGCAVYDTRN
jgi:hypothetical protein